MKKNIVVSVLVIVAIILAATGWWLWQNQNQANHKIIKPDSAKPAGRQADSSPAQTAGVTQVIRFVAKINSAAKQQFGDCFASSIAAYPRNDAWRCNIGNQIFDPCFSADKVDTVVCGADPMKNDDGFPLLLKKPLPAADSSAATTAWAWFLELSDGTVCAPFTGTRAMVENEMITYGCSLAGSDANIVILGDLNSGGKLGPSRWRKFLLTKLTAKSKLTKSRL